MSEKVPRCSLHMLRCQCIFQGYSILYWGESTDTSCNLQPKISYLQSCCWSRNFGSDSRIVYFFQLLVLLQAPKPIDRSITQTQEWSMHASSSILTCRLPKNVYQPLELQLGLLRPVDFAHPRLQSNRMGTRLPSLKHIFAPHTLQPPRRQGVSAGVSAFTYRHKLGTVNNLWIICHFQPTNFTYIPSICTAKYTLKAL